MGRRDHYHDAVVHALEKAGWTVTEDPLTVKYGDRRLFVDLGAENLIAAEKDRQRIAVEIKSFLGHSEVHDLEVALGQFVLYRSLLKEQEPDRILYLAVPTFAHKDVFSDKFGLFVIEQNQLRILVFDEKNEELVQWIP